MLDDDVIVLLSITQLPLQLQTNRIDVLLQLLLARLLLLLHYRVDDRWRQLLTLPALLARAARVAFGLLGLVRLLVVVLGA